MKLFARYNRYNIALTIFIFLAGSIAFYFVLQYVLLRQLDETLRGEQQEIVANVTAQGKLPEIQNTKTQWITLTPVTDSLQKSSIVSLSQFNGKEKENESVRQLSFTVSAGSRWYLIRVNKSETETEDLLQLIILVTIGMIALILLANYLLNRKIAGRIWQPFYNTLYQISNYQVNNQQPLQLPREPTEEIDQLNESLNRMTERIHSDYHSLKTFTENASHEIQTPLAIISSKIEALLQDMEGSQKNMQQLLVMEDAARKLSRLHQSLLLLTKLENRQFPVVHSIELSTILLDKLKEREELIEVKKIKLQIDYCAVTIPLHQHLAEILVSNLLANSIRYTPEAGIIAIELNTKKFLIKNTAAANALQYEKVFQRFYKEDPGAGGTGLGLAIVKEICLSAGFTIEYQFAEGFHLFTIHFSA